MHTLSLTDNPIVPWAIGLAVGFPLTEMVLGEIASRARRERWATAGIIAGIRILVVPMLALSLFMRYVLDMPADDTLVQVVKTILWIAVLHQGLSFVNQVVFGSAEEGTWQSRVPSLVRDLTRFALVAIGAAVIYSEVWGKEIGAAWAALGLGSVVIGLALQEPLGNTVSGLILLAERPLAVGDWIVAEGATGEVIEINWRSVRVLTSELELKIIPNSALYRGSFSNLSRPTPERAGSVDIRFSSGLPPYQIKAILLDMLKSVPRILQNPAPEVVIVEYAGDGILYRLNFRVSRPEDLAAAKDTVLARAWYVAQREALAMPGQPPRPGYEKSPLDVLEDFPMFAMDLANSGEIARNLRLLTFGAGETVVTEKGPLLGLHLVVSGQAQLTARDRNGQVQNLGQIGRGDFFGENAMVAGHPSDVTVTALEDVEFLIIEPEALQKLLEQSPRLVHNMGHVLESRRAALHAVRSLKRTPAPPAADAA
jgi:small-conductance mechanosensitive channel